MEEKVYRLPKLDGMIVRIHIKRDNVLNIIEYDPLKHWFITFGEHSASGEKNKEIQDKLFKKHKVAKNIDLYSKILLEEKKGIMNLYLSGDTEKATLVISDMVNDEDDHYELYLNLEVAPSIWTEKEGAHGTEKGSPVVYKLTATNGGGGIIAILPGAKETIRAHLMAELRWKRQAMLNAEAEGIDEGFQKYLKEQMAKNKEPEHGM